jgi:zinc protease
VTRAVIDTRMQIAHSKHTLDNGLDVIIHEDHDLPIVAVNLWYHVGSKNERPGLTGFAHLFEHLMFEGSQHHDTGYFQPLQEAGASLNGSTNADRTNYWEVVPTNALDLALWLESDRMGYLLPALTPQKLQKQRDVVLNERRQNYENRPYGLTSMATASALYPPDHPYHWMTIGAAEDIRAASFDDVRAFFERYYHPGNASLVLAGDVETGRALDLARAYFGDIPAGQAVGRVVAAEPVLDGEKRLLLEDRVELPRLYLAWTSPALFADGDAAHDLVAEVLSHGRTSRLYRTLVYERRMALDVAAIQQSREVGGLFQIIATAAPGVGLSELDAVIQDEVARLAADGPTEDELARSLTQAEAQFIFRLQTVGGFNGKSDQLNAYNIYVSDPGYFQEDLNRYRRLTAGEVATAARRLSPDRRVALSVVPSGRQELALAGSNAAVVS